MPRKIHYKKGDLIGTLTYLYEIDPIKYNRRAWMRCPCGKEFAVLICSAKTLNTRSCGCFIGVTPKNKTKSTHSLSRHPIYKLWKGIKTRCYNKNRADYKYYGGRGVYLSDEFINDFLIFYNYVCALPGYDNREELNLTLDRIDNMKGYERNNLRWATKTEQCYNQNRKDPIIPSKAGRLTALNVFLKDKCRYVECICDCGEKKTCRLSDINSGDIKSCGCLSRDNARQMGFKNRKIK